MAREIILKSSDGNVSRFGLSKVDRAKLYGRRRRVHLGPDGEPCRRASLTDDGAELLVSGMTAQGYFTVEGQWIPNGELVGLNDEGEALEEAPSTLGVAQDLDGPVDPSELLDLRTQSVYALEASEVDESLIKQLLAGEIFRFRFNYRAGYSSQVAFLVANPSEQVFAIVGDATQPDWQDVKAIIPLIDETADEDDDLDFEMF